MMRDKDKRERRNNIVLEGVRLDEGDVLRKENLKNWVQKFLEEKIKTKVPVVNCRESGNEIIASLELNEEDKKEVMQNKNRLKGDRIFIENDLTYKERKIQERIYKWVKLERDKGEEVKIRIGKVRVKGVWRNWRETEKEMNGTGKDSEKTSNEEEGGSEVVNFV